LSAVSLRRHAPLVQGLHHLAAIQGVEDLQPLQLRDELLGHGRSFGGFDARSGEVEDRHGRDQGLAPLLLLVGLSDVLEAREDAVAGVGVVDGGEGIEIEEAGEVAIAELLPLGIGRIEHAQILQDVDAVLVGEIGVAQVAFEDLLGLGDFPFREEVLHGFAVHDLGGGDGGEHEESEYFTHSDLR
jgi:hypothetical protein